MKAEQEYLEELLRTEEDAMGFCLGKAENHRRNAELIKRIISALKERTDDDSPQ